MGGGAGHDKKLTNMTISLLKNLINIANYLANNTKNIINMIVTRSYVHIHSSM